MFVHCAESRIPMSKERATIETIISAIILAFLVLILDNCALELVIKYNK